MRLRAQQIIVAVADAAARWRNADYPERVRATRAIRERTAYTEPVVDYALDALFGSIDRATLRATIESELGSIAALDGFIARPGRPDVMFCGLERATIVSSDTTIGVAIPALIFALCAQARVVVKDRDDRLVAAFARSVVAERPELGERIVTAIWSGADDDANAFLERENVVVAYGRAATLRSIRERLAPDARFLAFGHRTSIAYVGRETLCDEGRARAAAWALARDALLYDGDGCLSPHASFVESEAPLSAQRFARIVADACDEVAFEFPAGYAEPDPDVIAYRRAATFRAAQGSGALFTGTAGPHTLVLDPPRDETPPLLRRTLALYAVRGPADALAFVRRHALPLEAVGVWGEARDDVTAFACASGASRIATLGTLQSPPLGGEHGGEGRIRPFVRAMYRA